MIYSEDTDNYSIQIFFPLGSIFRNDSSSFDRSKVNASPELLFIAFSSTLS